MPTPPAFLAAQAPETAFVQPFALNAGDRSSGLKPPYHLAHEEWARDFNEIKALGSAVGSSRTAEQTDIARFWSDNPPLQWNRAWRALSMAKGLGLADNARYFAMLATASADALIACWDAKFFYNFWRPVTAIRAADADGNPNTAPDPAWIGLIVTPNHPEYPAAHGCFSGASTETLTHFFGTDDVALSVDSNVPGLQHSRAHVRSLLRRADRGPRGPNLRRDALPALDANRRHDRQASVQVHDEALLPQRPNVVTPSVTTRLPWHLADDSACHAPRAECVTVCNVTSRNTHRRPLTELQQAILDQLWSSGPATADQIREALLPAHRLKDSSVRTLLRRLEVRGYVSHRLEGKTFVYEATIAPKRVAAHSVRQMIDRFWSGSVEQFLTGMVDEKILTPAEIARLARKISLAKKRKKTDA